MYDDVGDFPIFRPLLSAGKFKLASLTFAREASRRVVLKWPLSGELDMDSLLKSFHCTFCSKHFTTDYGSDNHQRAVHSDRYSQLKRFACTACPRRFVTENDLKHHEENASKRHKKMTGNNHQLQNFYLYGHYVPNTSVYTQLLIVWYERKLQ